MANEASETWWGEFPMDVDRALGWRIGPLRLEIRRLRAEWQLAWSEEETAEGELEAWQAGLEIEEVDESGHFERFVFRRSPQPLRIVPALADRGVVTSPRAPFRLLPGEETRLYVGSPLWLRIEVGEPPRRLRELPIRRPNDTWFGASTRAGELCYATRTRAILDPENLPQLWRRAVTPVTLRNLAPDELALDKLKLPVPFLSVFATADNHLWTEAVTLERRESGEMANLDIRPGAPEEATGADLLTPPRAAPESEGLNRVFSSLLESLKG